MYSAFIMFAEANLLAILFLASITEYSSCCANRLNDDDVSILLKIVEDANPNLVRIVYDNGAAATSDLLSRIVHRITDNKKRISAIPINIDTVGAKSEANLFQNYTTFTIIIADDNRNAKIDAIVSDIDQRLHRKHLSKYLVVFQTISNGTDDSEWTRKMFQLFWERRVLDVVLFYRDKNSIVLKTFNPFQPSRELSVIDFGVNSSVNELYASKLLNLNGYEFNILALDVIFISVRKNNGTGFEGVDGNMIEFFGQK